MLKVKEWITALDPSTNRTLYILVENNKKSPLYFIQNQEYLCFFIHVNYSKTYSNSVSKISSVVYNNVRCLLVQQLFECWYFQKSWPEDPIEDHGITSFVWTYIYVRCIRTRFGYSRVLFYNSVLKCRVVFYHSIIFIMAQFSGVEILKLRGGLFGAHSLVQCKAFFKS